MGLGSSFWDETLIGWDKHMENGLQILLSGILRKSATKKYSQHRKVKF